VTDRVLRWADSRFIGEVGAGSGEWRRDEDVVRVRQGEADEAAFWELTFEHPDRQGDYYRWRTEIRLATTGQEVAAYIDVRLLGVGQALRPEGKDVARPSVLRDIAAEFTCSFGGHPLHVRALHVTKANAETFTRDVILHPLRRLPVVVVSDGPHGFALDPDALQSSLVGLATVARYDDEASWALTEVLGSALTCFGGAIRIYWPGCATTDNPWRHRRWLPEHARDLRAQLPRILFNEFASRFPRFADQLLFEEVTRRVRRAEQEETLRNLQQTGADEEFVQFLSDTVEEAERQRDLWEQRALQLEQEGVALRQELAQVKQNFRFIGVAAGGSIDEDDSVEVDSVRPADDLAARMGSVRILPSAFDSADASPFHDPPAVYAAFEALDELSKELRQGESLGRSVEDWLRDRGVDYSPHESATAMGRWGNERRFRDGDLIRTIQGHLKFGADGDPRYCLRIYTEWDGAAEEWVVGHVGRHLTNTQS